MTEKTTKKVKKSLHFEESGETFSVELGLENVSPEIKPDTIMGYLDALFERAKERLIF